MTLSQQGLRRLFIVIWLTLPLASLIAGIPANSWSGITGVTWLGLLALIAANVAILLVPAVFIESRWAQRLVFLPLLAVALFTLSYMLHNGASPSPDVFVSIFRTNPREFAEAFPGLLRAYGPGWALFAILSCLVWCMPAPGRSASKAARLIVINIAIWLANAFAAAWAFWPQGFARLVPAGAEYAIFPGNVLFTAYSAYKVDVGDSLTDEQLAFRFNATAKDATLPLRIVLVVGESSSAERWQLGEYSRPTNPLLTFLSSGRLIYFPNVLAGGTTTRSTVPLILTRATPSTLSIANKERSVISAFSESGYMTAWISNQDRFPYSKEAKNEIYINPDWSAATSRYDEDLLPIALRQLNAQRRVFLVIHTLGSHVQYRYRVPQSERFFAKAAGSDTLDEYDDTIRYTDKFLASLIDMLVRIDDAPSVLLYISDHGQDLARAAVGDLSQGAPVFQRSLIHVPLLVWMSPRYLQAWPEVATSLAQNRHCPHSQIEIFHTLIKMGHIELPNSGPSLFNSDCRQHRSVLIGAGIVDYP